MRRRPGFLPVFGVFNVYTRYLQQLHDIRVDEAQDGEVFYVPRYTTIGPAFDRDHVRTDGGVFQLSLDQQ
eukprot:800815-Pyramimonas_sp.AAC.1